MEEFPQPLTTPHLCFYLWICDVCTISMFHTAPPPPAELSKEKRAAVVKQVEFYFSDENLPTDKFMKQRMQKGGAQGKLLRDG